MRVETIGDCVLYLGDCLEIAPSLIGIDAIVADPPYDIGYIPRGDSKNIKRNFGPKDKIRGDNGNLDFDPRPFLDLAGEQIWWGANHYANKLPNSRGWLVWIKARGMEKTEFSHFEMAWSTRDCPAKALDHRWMGMIKDSERGIAAIHPTQKPIVLMLWCLRMINGHVVLDPYMGSATTGIACMELGKKFVGIESDDRHFDNACERLSRYERQGDLFRKRTMQETLNL